MTTVFTLTAALLAFWSCGPAWASGAGEENSAPVCRPTILSFRTHGKDLYTQGLFIHGDSLYESSGRYGRSALYRWTLQEGRPLTLAARFEPPAEVFAEGAAWADGEIYLLSWREERGWVLNPDTLTVKREFTYSGEGWGLTYDGERLWRSDGSDALFPHQPGDFAPAGPPVRVRDQGRPVPLLNELEWDPRQALLLANIFTQNRVAAIDPRDGRVVFWLDARELGELSDSGLPKGPEAGEAVLNGLALTPEDRGLWLTGKLWPRLYQIAWPPEAP